MKNKTPYKAFGVLLTELRLKAGISQQSQLASLIKSTQQTVSRWELGISRPRYKQIFTLAQVLQIDNTDMFLTAAGYSRETTTVSFDQPFPINALDPTNFERFCFYFLSHLHPEATVHRAGGSGHTQDGIDIDVTFRNKKIHTFQCKQVSYFGPGDVKDAITAQIKVADKKFLLLSHIASPQARATIKQYKDWDIWDKEDVSRIIRQELSKTEQIELVDIFFPKQRFALLGETEVGPWQTFDKFFASYLDKKRLFNHVWKMIGRAEENQKLTEALLDQKIAVIFLIGNGGSGKTKLLKEAIEMYKADHQDVLIRFLSPTEEITSKSLENLGNHNKLLIVDDAHDQEDLRLLFQYASIPNNKTKILLSFRRYGLEYIKQQAAGLSLVNEHVQKIEINPLTLKQTTELAIQVLSEFNESEALAEDIARHTSDCPLATVIAAQIVAKEKISYELVKNEASFRDTLLGRFKNIIAGNVGKRSDAEPINKLLKILALLQPFYPEDENIISIAEKIEGLKAHDVKRLIFLLVEAGVLFKRGGKYRLSPDLLADHIIEETCKGLNGSTGYAEQVFHLANKTSIEQLLLNLGKLDWRLVKNKQSNINLLDGIWKKLKATAKDNYDSYIEAIIAVAYYQPEYALDFAKKLIQNGKCLHDLPKLLKQIAYNYDYLPSACKLLWELGKNDTRSLNQNSNHAIRILYELATFEPNKPIYYNQTVLEFILQLAEQNDSWHQAYTPFDILKGILQTNGYIPKEDGINFHLIKFTVNHSTASSFRKQVIDATINLLSHPEIKIGILAADFLQHALHYPMNAADDIYESYTTEFIKTLEKIEKVLTTKKLDQLIQIKIADSISWHANYPQAEIKIIAKRIINVLPQSLEFRTILALIDGYGHLLQTDGDLERRNSEWEQYTQTLTKELIITYPDGEKLRNYIEQNILHIENSGIKTYLPYVLYRKLIQDSLALAQATIDNALLNPTSKTTTFVGPALAKLLQANHIENLSIVEKLLNTDITKLHMAVGYAYSEANLTFIEPKEKDFNLLKTLLTSTNKDVILSGLAAIRNLAKNNQSSAIKLIKCVDLGISNEIADNTLALFHTNDNTLFNLLTENDVEHFLIQLKKLPELEGHWIETFLAKSSTHYAKKTATFFMDRVTHAVKINSWAYRPCNYRPYGHVPLQFRESSEFSLLMHETLQWMKLNEESNRRFQELSAELFHSMFLLSDSDLVNIFQNWIDTIALKDMWIITQIISAASHTFVFEQQHFVIHFLEKMNKYGIEQLNAGIDNFYRSAITGLRTGIPGQPYPRDIYLREEAKKVLKKISRFSPAYELYKSLKEHAEICIERSRKDAEYFEN